MIMIDQTSLKLFQGCYNFSQNYYFGWSFSFLLLFWYRYCLHKFQSVDDLNTNKIAKPRYC